MCNLVFVRCLQTSVSGAERGSRVSQGVLNARRGRVRATEHAPCDSILVLERRHGFLGIAKRGALVRAKRSRV